MTTSAEVRARIVNAVPRDLVGPGPGPDCQTACNLDPRSASKFDPPRSRVHQSLRPVFAEVSVAHRSAGHGWASAERRVKGSITDADAQGQFLSSIWAPFLRPDLAPTGRRAQS